ncbi:type I restriction-modification system subunit M N-terminal domain-containing protein [Sphaerospermopsis aphanizomenoides]|uniref:type I restriction-modification system subunit M N-terminal domain-containing protein n=1 Tax=Sphaerospermopsis aphanizomenoides TaxID=459663 RepID=UPI001F388FFE|nr:type I restriction-modification system subunit M N-terminal domain-containing protein [Sphaerospermopsis aphanizomenoides]
MAANTTDLEKRLWDAADELRANSKLKSSEYSVPVLGLIFLRYADWKFTKIEQELKSKVSSRRKINKGDYHDKGVMYLPEEARFSYLLNLPENENFGKKINDAMKAIEKENKDLEGALPNSYTNLDNELLVELLKKFNKIN